MNADLTEAPWRPGYTEDPHPSFTPPPIPPPLSQAVVEGVPVWLVTRYDDVRRLLVDPGLSTDPRNAGPAAREVPWIKAGAAGLARHMLRQDAPDHTRLRKLVSMTFTARRVEGLRPRVQEVADDLVRRILPRGHADLVSDFALPLPFTVLGDLLGVPPDGREELLHWSNIYAGVSEGDLDRRPEAIAWMEGYLNELIGAKSAQRPAEAEEGSLLDGLIAVRDQGERLSHQELLSLAFLLLAAGYETAATLISNGMLALLHHPGPLGELRADPSRLGPAIEEFLRYDSPVKVAPMVRFSVAEVRVDGTVIPAGETLVLFLSAANRDSGRFSDPGLLDIGRDARGHLAFGHGAHFCVGAPLARLEAEVAFSTLLTRVPELALGPARPTWRHNFFLHSLKSLPVTFPPSPQDLPAPPLLGGQFRPVGRAGGPAAQVVADLVTQLAGLPAVEQGARRGPGQHRPE
jgi:cytochrome P450